MIDNFENRLCACLTENDIEKCLKTINEIDINLVEHRIDFLEKAPTFEELKNLYCTGEKENKIFIATCRNTSCGGKFNGGEEERTNILINAINAGAKYVDIEIETDVLLGKKIIAIAKEKNCQVIASMHNFNLTPTKEDLLLVLEKEKEFGNIGKIVCKANSVEDAKNLLDLILIANGEDFPLIAFGMGEIGRFSRIVSLIYGSPFTFVSVNVASAPGQLSLNKAREIINLLGVKNGEY